MEISAAILCDSATVREGLLHVLGGGVTRLWRSQLPAPLGVTLAVITNLGEADFGRPHEVRILVANSLGDVAQGVGAFQSERPEKLEPGELQVAPFVHPLLLIPTGAYGKHTLEIDIDSGAATRHLDFWVLHPEEGVLPPRF